VREIFYSVLTGHDTSRRLGLTIFKVSMRFLIVFPNGRPHGVIVGGAADPKLFRNLRLHDLRYEAISRLFEKGLRMEEVAAISGHQDWRSLKRYTHSDPEKLAQRLRNVAH